MAQEAEDREKVIPELRLKSRRDYLVKRKDDKIRELEADIIDDEFLFDQSQLTERERQEMKYKKNILELARQHDKASEVEKVQRYQMPKDRKGKEVDSYVEVDEKEKMPNYEQKKWEEEHLQSATYRFGAKNAKERHSKKEKQYDYILDDEIEFVQALKMPGTKQEPEEKKLSEYDKKKMSIEETKKSLPVYPFKQDLLEAIKEHQVILFSRRKYIKRIYLSLLKLAISSRHFFCTRFFSGESELLCPNLPSQYSVIVPTK